MKSGTGLVARSNRAICQGVALRIEADARAENQELALGLARNMAVILSHEGSLKRFLQKLQTFVVRKRNKNGVGGSWVQ